MSIGTTAFHRGLGRVGVIILAVRIQDSRDSLSSGDCRQVFEILSTRLPFRGLLHDANSVLSGPNMHDSVPQGSKKLAHRSHAEGCSLSAKRGQKMPPPHVHHIAAIAWSPSISPRSLGGPSTVSLQPNRIHRLWVWATGPNTKTTKPAIPCGLRLSWCPRQDSNLRRPG